MAESVQQALRGVENDPPCREIDGDDDGPGERYLPGAARRVEDQERPSGDVDELPDGSERMPVARDGGEAGGFVPKDVPFGPRRLVAGKSAKVASAESLDGLGRPDPFEPDEKSFPVRPRGGDAKRSHLAGGAPRAKHAPRAEALRKVGQNLDRRLTPDPVRSYDAPDDDEIRRTDGGGRVRPSSR